MEITQSYARPSTIVAEADGLRFEMATETHRPPVALKAQIADSPAYARAMLALFQVVSDDQRFQAKDHADYQAWVQARYLEELAPELEANRRALPAQMAQRDQLQRQLNALEVRAMPLRAKMSGPVLWGAKKRYWKWLYKRDFALWMLLDPVVSVHPDGVIFEVFSRDESSYGRVTIPTEKLQIEGEVTYGTTNVDFSQALADEIKRVRSYRPARLSVGGGGIALETAAGTRFEKKIDLPPTWVRGFLQVQSAASLPGHVVSLSASVVADILFALRQRREKQGPRALRFVLARGQKPTVVIEPWGVTLSEPNHVFEGDFAGEIRVWGRRRLFALEGLLPFANDVQVRLLGSGMPSYWTTEQGGHRFDLGLSGWSANDWSKAARFDLLASSLPALPLEVEVAARELESMLRLSPVALADRTDLSREAATGALQQLCREGRAMFDPTTGVYRWRQLLPFPAPPDANDVKMAYARRLVQSGAVKRLPLALSGPDSEVASFAQRVAGQNVKLFHARVKGEQGGQFEPTVGLDADGRAVFAQCTCGDFRRDKLRKGPCAHILALAAIAAQQGAGLSPDRFKDQTFVFTGALTLFTREQAQALVERGGGKASGSVARGTTFLVAGEKVGSKLDKARRLGVHVLSEAEFQTMLEGGSEGGEA